MDMISRTLVVKIVGSAIRHALTAGAAALVTYGLTTQSGADQLVDTFTAAGMAALGLGWAWWDKYGHAKLSRYVARMKGSAKGV